MARRIPPFAALRAFESAARQGNLRRAGEELSLSVSAVSHQVKALEEFLGVRIFTREKGRMVLTSIGREYLGDLTHILDQLDNATARVQKSRQAKRVTINLFPSVAALWLLPRLSHYRRLEPAVDVQVMTSVQPVEFRSGIIDIAIWYCTSPPAEFTVDVLFSEQAFPVCSPSYLDQTSGSNEDGDLSNLTLVRCKATSSEWEEWFDRTAYRGGIPTHHFDVDSYALALEAAADGLGLAMGRTPLVDRVIGSGGLVRPFGDKIETGFSYYLVAPERSLRSRAVRSFRRWLLSESRNFGPIYS